MSNTYDVIIIGSGPGGYVTAVRSAQLGFKTAIVEREHLGGICLNWGCIPTKALLRSAEILHFSERADSYGLKLEGKVSADIQAVVQRSRGVSARLNGGVGFLMKKNKVDVIWGEAKLTKAAKGGALAEIERLLDLGLDAAADADREIVVQVDQLRGAEDDLLDPRAEAPGPTCGCGPRSPSRPGPARRRSGCASARRTAASSSGCRWAAASSR